MNFGDIRQIDEVHTTLAKDVPEGWAKFPLKTIAKRITKGATPTSYGFKYQEKGIRFVKAENLKDGRINCDSIRHFISEEANLNQSRSILQAGDLLFSIAGTIGKTCLVRKEDLPANTNQALAIIRGTSDVLLPDLLQLQLRSEMASRQITNQARGGSMNNISLADVSSIQVLIPPLTEQKRIVTKVAELLTRVNAVKERLAKTKEILKHFRQSVLAAACSGHLTVGWRDENLGVESARVLFNSIEQKREREYVEECRRAKAEKRRKPSKWTNLSKKLHAENVEEFASIPSTWIYVPLGKVAGRGTDSIVDGPFGTSINVKIDYISCGVPVVRINNIRAFRFLPDDLRFVSELKYQQLIRHCILPGDILLTKVGTIGEACVFPDSYQKAMLSTTGSCRIRVDAELADNKYICIYLNFLKQYLNSIVSESVQPFLNMRVIKNLPAAIPPLEEQREIVRRVEALFNLANQIEKRVAAAGERAERLTQAILAKAFRGELVPNEAELARQEGRSCESTSALVAKIKTQRS